MRKQCYSLGIIPFNGEPSRVWLILGSIFVASSVVRKRIQIDIAFDEHDPRPLDEDEKKIFENIDLSI